MTGIIIVDKPAGWTSHDVVAKLRGALKEKRIGHGGTLDPLATGVLPVFIGRATRAAEFCENAEKEYIAGLRLGLATDTQDITGETVFSCGAVCGECGAQVSTDDILSVLRSFTGAQKQTPPMYSAVKIGGKKLYEMARQGVTVPRPERDITISEIELLGRAHDELTLRVVCSKGTYIRTLCHDIGAALGCGAAMCSLRRTRAGAFTIDQAHALDRVLEAGGAGLVGSVLIPVDKIFLQYPPVTLGMQDAAACKNGTPRSAGLIADGTYRFYGPDNEFLILGMVKSGKIEIIKGFFEV